MAMSQAMNAPFSTMGKPEPQIVVFTPGMRTLIADAIESMIHLLDEIDGDVDAEDDDPAEETGDAEPSLGAFELMNQEKAWSSAESGWGGQDLELDEADHEPSLAAPERHASACGASGSQVDWTAGGSLDLEVEVDGNEEPNDRPPFIIVHS
jgi:hypothetical protein